MSLLAGTLRELAGFTEALKLQARATQRPHGTHGALTQRRARRNGRVSLSWQRPGLGCAAAAPPGRDHATHAKRNTYAQSLTRRVSVCPVFLHRAAQTDSVLVEQLSALERGPLDEVKALRKCAPPSWKWRRALSCVR